MAGVMMLSLTANASAAEFVNDDDNFLYMQTEDGTKIYDSETVLIDDGTRLPEPRNNYKVIDQEITSNGASWSQPFNYSSYRIWIRNDTNETMTIIHESGLVHREYSVPANTGKVVEVVNDAVPFASHKLDFATSSGIVSGWVAVRVADVNQSYS